MICPEADPIDCDCSSPLPFATDRFLTRPSSVSSTPYSFARDSYAAVGIDTEAVFATLERKVLSKRD